MASSDNITLHNIEVVGFWVGAPIGAVENYDKLKFRHNKNILAAIPPCEIAIDGFVLP